VKKKGQYMKTEILIHIPHSSYYIPTEYKNLFLINKQELKKEQLLMTDSYTDELFNTGQKQIIFPISRLICDVKRFRSKQDEEMTQQGMWVCYTKRHNQENLKRITKSHEEEILEKFYDKHHQLFEKEVENILNQNNKCLIIDAHSFCSKVLPYELYKDESRPQICLGTDDFHTDSNIINYFKKAFEEKGYKVDVNSPFKGTIVPLKFYKKENKVQSIMIEINRNIYMDEKTGKRTKRFATLQKDLKEIISKYSTNLHLE
jgi:N-formylglutamate amidohydrolase